MNKFFLSYGYKGPDGFTTVDLNQTKIDSALDDGQAESLVVYDVLSHFEASQLESVVRKLCRKVRVGHQVTFVFVDLLYSVKAHCLERFSFSDLNRLVFGEASSPKRSALRADEIQDILLHLGMKIQRMQIDNGMHNITATKGT